MQLISVCICTYQRPSWLRRLLIDLGQQDTRERFTFEIIVADNDVAQSARQVAHELASIVPVPIFYCSEPRRNISHARNASLAAASGSLIAFIDDDEFPAKDWLLNLFQTWSGSGMAGVLGPVWPHFDDRAPEWVKRGGFYSRPEYKTGFLVPWQQSRTGNVLFDRSILLGLNPVFRPEFGTGAGDVDFFRRMTEAGHKFIWCNEAIVHEIVPLNRCKRAVMIRRALLRGSNSFRHPRGRNLRLAKALLAVPVYACVLPFLLFAGQHVFMRYCIKLCDHVGRLFASVGITLVRQRAM